MSRPAPTDANVTPSAPAGESSTPAAAPATEATPSPAAPEIAPAEPKAPVAETRELNLTDAERAKWLQTGELPETQKPVEPKSAGEQPGTSSASEAGTHEGAESSAPADNAEKPKTRGADVRKQQLDREIKERLDKRKTLGEEVAELERKKAAALADPAPAVKPAAPVTDPAAPKEPNFADFADPADYWAKYQEFTKDQRAYDQAQFKKEIADALTADRKAQIEQAAQEKIARDKAEREEAAEQKLLAHSPKHTDFKDAVIESGVSEFLTPAMDGYITEDEHGPEILYRLGKDLMEGGTLAARLSKMSPFKALEHLVGMKNAIAEEIEREKKPVLPRAGGVPANLAGNNAKPRDAMAEALKANDFTTYNRLKTEQELAEFRARR